MKRIKEFEHPWIVKDCFTVNGYIAKKEDGKTYVVYAHNYRDLEIFMMRLRVAAGNFTTNAKAMVRDKKEKPKKKPFWYRGRVYEMEG